MTSRLIHEISLCHRKPGRALQEKDRASARQAHREQTEERRWLLRVGCGSPGPALLSSSLLLPFRFQKSSLPLKTVSFCHCSRSQTHTEELEIPAVALEPWTHADRLAILSHLPDSIDCRKSPVWPPLVGEQSQLKSLPGS